MHWSEHYLNQSSGRTVKDSQSVLVLLASQPVPCDHRPQGSCQTRLGSACQWVGPPLASTSLSEAPLSLLQTPREAKGEDEQAAELRMHLK